MCILLFLLAVISTCTRSQLFLNEIGLKLFSSGAIISLVLHSEAFTSVSSVFCDLFLNILDWVSQAG